MNKVIAAVDNSLSTGPVLATAVGLARILAADVEALHVVVDGDRVARAAAENANVRLATVTGPVVQRLVEAGSPDDVIVLVIGARGTPAGRRPLGATALAVATTVQKPVLVVPPDVRRPGKLSRVLVPVEGTAPPALTPQTIIDLGGSRRLDVVLLHVLEEAALPSFTDQPQHEAGAWTREFLRRYCPWGIGTIDFQIRVGRAEDLVPAVADEVEADLVALGWAQELAPGRAPVVLATLARIRTPVMLIPVRLDDRATTSQPRCTGAVIAN